MNYESEAKMVAKRIEDILNSAGIFFRIFHRGKNIQSLKRKIDSNPGKYGKFKKIQDLIGIRVCLYFSDDISLAKDLICNKFQYDPDSSSIDLPEKTEFGPTRYNLIFHIPKEISQSLDKSTFDDVIDTTFELQIRTILSEGWHEVEHDLRYKFPQDWEDHEWASRAFNGVFAGLETSEWTMLKILDDQAHINYKNSNWPAMIRSKFRLRFSDHTLDPQLVDWLNKSPADAKALFRASREEAIADMLAIGNVPITMNNLLYIHNVRVARNEQVLRATPKFLLHLIESRSIENDNNRPRRYG
jgi:putative GTP pyrophosphokinase